MDRHRRIWDAGSPVELIHMVVMQLLLAGPRYNWMYKAAYRYDPEAALKGLECPTLLLNAGKDPLAFKDEKVAALLRDGRVVHFDDLPGQLPCRAPERFVSEIAKFIGVDAVARARRTGHLRS